VFVCANISSRNFYLMRPSDCSPGSSYFDPNTDRCHPCSDCDPPRDPNPYCKEGCQRKVQGKCMGTVLSRRDVKISQI